MTDHTTTRQRTPKSRATLKSDCSKAFCCQRMYQAKLHDGGVGVMILAQQAPRADLVILDDNAAKFLGLTVTGTLGVLLKAKQAGLLPSVAPVLHDLQQKGFYVMESVRTMVLKNAGESEQ